jgi:hypothetical protein
MPQVPQVSPLLQVPPMPQIPPYPAAPTPSAGAFQAEQAEVGGKEAEEPNLEAEREAILRMIAEGRITPDEGDMLLEGLGN